MNFVVLFVFVLFLASCSDDASKKEVNSQNNVINNLPNNVNGQNNLGCGISICAAVTCGVVTDDCGNDVDCGGCQYESTVIAEDAFRGNLVVADKPYLVYEQNQEGIFIAELDGETWTSKLVSDASVENDNQIAVAATESGDVFLAWEGENAVVLASPDNDEWTTEPVPELVFSEFLALAATEDRIALAYSNTVEVGVMIRDDGDWSNLPLELDSDEAQNRPTIDIEIAGDEVLLAWFSPLTKILHLSTSTGSSWDTIDLFQQDGIPGEVRSLSMVVRNDRIYIALGTNNTLFVGEVVDGMWVGDSVAGLHADRDNGLVVDEQGNISVAYYDNNSLNFAEQVGSTWATQELNAECDEGHTDAVLDTNGDLLISFNCSQRVRVLKRKGRYPDDYFDKCDQITSALCEKASECKTMDDVCVDGFCTSPFACPINFRANVCGDATQDPEVLDDCLPATPTLQCSEGSVVLPESCRAAWR